MAFGRTSFEEARAKQWMRDVEQTILETENILKQVGATLEEYDESDTILDSVRRSGQIFEQSAAGYCIIFNYTVEAVSNAISNIVSGIQKAIEKVEEFANQMK